MTNETQGCGCVLFQVSNDQKIGEVQSVQGYCLALQLSKDQFIVSTTAI